MAAPTDKETPSPLIVHVDSDLEALIPGFMENRKNDIAAIQTALVAGDFGTIRLLGHSMKGAGGGYGFDAITDIGAAMETAAEKQDSPAVKRLVERLGTYLDRVQIVYT